MKKVLKKCCAYMLVAALAVSGLALTPNVSLAAKKPALNKKKVSVKVGATYKLKVKNANKKAKVAWKSGNKKVVKLTKLVKKGKKASAVINGVAEGTATVKATYKLAGTKKKTLKCKVTVTPADNAAPASAATTAPAGATTQQPAGTTAAPDKSAAPTSSADTPATDTPGGDTPTAEPTERPTRTPRVTGTPTVPPTASPVPTQAPDMSADFDLTSFTTENDAATLVNGNIVIEDPRGDSDSTVVYLPLPGNISYGETVTIRLTGSSTGETSGFRVWVGDGPHSGTGSPARIENLGTAGDFDRTFTVTAYSEEDANAADIGTNPINMLTIKSLAWNGPAIKGITITSLHIYYTDRGAVVGGSTPAPTATPTAEPTTAPTLEPGTTEAPATATPEPTDTPVPATPLPDVSGPLTLSGTTDDENGGSVTYDSVTDTVLINDTEDNEDDKSTAVYIPLPGPVAYGETVQITIKGSSDGTSDGFRTWVGDGPNSGTVTPYRIEGLTAGAFEQTFSIAAKTEAAATGDNIGTNPINMLTLKSLAWDGPRLTGITISSVEIVYTSRVEGAPTPTPLPDLSGELTLSGVSGSAASYDSQTGQITINDTSDANSTAVFIPLPGEVAFGEKVTIHISGSTDGSCDGFRVWVGDGVHSGTVTPKRLEGLSAGSFDETFELTAMTQAENDAQNDDARMTGTCNMLTLKSLAWNGPKLTGITISSVDIYFTDRGAVVGGQSTPTPPPATATPTPTPTAEATQAPNFTASDNFEAGERYLLLFNNVEVNKDVNLYYQNVGTLYALTDSDNALAKTFSSEISTDRTSITIEDLNDVLNCVWICEAYEGSTTQFTLKNVGSDKYLYNNGTTIGYTDTITQAAAWTYESRTGENYSYNCIRSVSDTTKFVRISNGSGVFKFGSTSSNTDGRNANAYLYKFRSDLFSVPVDPSDDGWVEGWY